MNKSYCILFGLFFLFIFCKQREWDNPFDPDCPKELFTPSDFEAVQQNNYVVLEWEQTNLHISGFIIERRIGNGIWEEVAAIKISNTLWIDHYPQSDQINEYRIWAYAGSNQSKTITIQITPFLSGATGTFIDERDLRTYKWVRIGNQVWMSENLAYLPGINQPSTGSSTAAFYYVYGYNGSTILEAKSMSNYSVYGVLYNWYAAMGGAHSSNTIPSGIQGICPLGWHIPSDEEWIVLENYLIANSFNYDGSTTGNKIAKSLASASNWFTSETNGSPGYDSSSNNKSGFSALPGGYRNRFDGSFKDISKGGFWWSSTRENSNYIRRRYLLNNYVDLWQWDPYPPEMGFSIRCIKD